MLMNFLYANDIDVALLQEVTHESITDIPHYTAWVNIGTEQRGTATLAKTGITALGEQRIPTGRGLAIKFKDVWYVNVYAPSGVERRAERKHFFNVELLILPLTPTALIIAGNFNCILEACDTMGSAPRSAALERLTTWLRLQDAWDRTNRNRGFTHYAQSASRLDHIYVTERLHCEKIGVETAIVAFTDHMAVILHLSTDTSYPEHGPGFWKLNVSLLRNDVFHAEVTQKWWDWT
jgi:endonuclease/exonuclease/phosphatase family metal-dependent hydrolase